MLNAQRNQASISRRFTSARGAFWHDFWENDDDVVVSFHDQLQRVQLIVAARGAPRVVLTGR